MSSSKTYQQQLREILEHGFGKYLVPAGQEDPVTSIVALTLDLVGEDRHSELGEDDDTDFAKNQNELRQELRSKIKEAE